MNPEAARPSLRQVRRERAGRGRPAQRKGRERAEEVEAPASKHPREGDVSASTSPARLPEGLPSGASTEPSSQPAPLGAPQRAPTRPQQGPSETTPPPELWAPAFTGRGGVALTVAASVRKDPTVANVLMRGIALPVDMSATDAVSLDDNFLELHESLVKACQASVASHKKVVALLRASRASEAKLKEERLAVGKLKQNLGVLTRQVTDLSSEKDGAEEAAAEAVRDARRAEERAKHAEEGKEEAFVRARAAEAKLAELQAAQAEMLAAADSNGYHRGEREAGQQYAQEAEEMELRSFRRGYHMGHMGCFPGAYTQGVDACGAPSDAAARTIPPAPEPQIPEMPLDDDDDEDAAGQGDSTAAPDA